MPRNLHDSEYIFGIHEPGGEQYMLESGHPGWIVFTEEIGHNPNNVSGANYTPYSGQGLGVISRLNNGYEPNGTIPNEINYEAFANRCAQFVANSPGCNIWIIGNEMNYSIERPPLIGAAAPSAPATPAPPPLNSAPPGNGTGFGVWVEAAVAQVAEKAGGFQPDGETDGATSGYSTPPPPASGPPLHGYSGQLGALYQPANGPTQSVAAAAPPVLTAGVVSAPAPAASAMSSGTGEVITPQMYARCYRLCRDAIHAVAGHGADQVLIGAVAPWNDNTRYPGNERGDWVKYMQDILHSLDTNGCDGIAMHTYTHGANANLITSTAKMNPPFSDRHYHFYAYIDFMNGIPEEMRNLPVYITETNQDVPWRDENIGWVQAAYAEIDRWNQQLGGQQIRSLVLYRWPRIDKWYIEGKDGVIADFRDALLNDYRWRKTIVPMQIKAGDVAKTTDIVNLRQTAGYLDKPPGDVLARLSQGTVVTILSDSHQLKDRLIWWNVAALSGMQQVSGWIAQNNAAGMPLLEKIAIAPPVLPPRPGTFAPGDRARTLDMVRMRRSPGYVGKPLSDVVTDIPAGQTVTIQKGPGAVDGLNYWQASAKDSAGSDVVGWMAEVAPNGAKLLEKLAQNPPFALQAPAEPRLGPGTRAQTLTTVRFRKSPGYIDKPADDVIADLPQQTGGTVVAGPIYADNLVWWQLDAPLPTNGVQRGWSAEVDPSGNPLLRPVFGIASPQPGPPSITRSDLLMTHDWVKVRRTPGAAAKPPEDVLGMFEPRTTVVINGGPQQVEGMTWWNVGGISSARTEIIGWVAEQTVGGTRLVGPPAKLSGSNIPDKASAAYLYPPYLGWFGVSQLWGERPQLYGQFNYAGTSLKGHNGIDFGLPVGTPITAVDDGIVAAAVYNDPTGFGHYVKLQHRWGESLYAHLDNLSVQTGQQVARGDILGYSGDSGMSSGPHLHFAIRINPFDYRDGWGGFSDPLPYFNPADIHMPAYVVGLAPVGAPAVAGALAPAYDVPGAQDDGQVISADAPPMVRPGIGLETSGGPL